MINYTDETEPVHPGGPADADEDLDVYIYVFEHL